MTVARALVLFALLPAACARPDADAAVRAAVVRYYERLSDRDWEGLRASFWPDASFTSVWQPPGERVERVVMTSIEAFIARGPEGPGSRSVFEERPLAIEVLAAQGVAVAWVRYAARFGDPGEVACWTGTDAITLLRHDGAWRIASIAFANDGEGGPAGPERCA